MTRRTQKTHINRRGLAKTGRRTQCRRSFALVLCLLSFVWRNKPLGYMHTADMQGIVVSVKRNAAAFFVAKTFRVLFDLRCLAFENITLPAKAAITTQ